MSDLRGIGDSLMTVGVMRGSVVALWGGDNAVVVAVRVSLDEGIEVRV